MPKKTETAQNSSGAAKSKKVPGKPFQKGQSGNPGGRPKVPEELREAFRANSQDACDALCKILKDPAAKDSDKIRAAEIILDRGYGKPTQAVDLEAAVTAPLTISFEGILDEWAK